MAEISFQIKALGCKVSQYDAAVLKRILEGRGFKIGGSPRLAVINTCTVTKKALVKDRNLAREWRRLYPDAVLVVMGCWPETDAEAGATLADSRMIVWGVGRTEELADRILEYFPEAAANRSSAMESGLLASFDRSRYFLKVGDGCNQFCSYCLIPFARGRLRSRPVSELVSEAAAAIATGYREIVLSGIHLGLYGSESGRHKSRLTVLLKKLLALPGLGRLRLSSIEINEVDDRLISLMAANRRICRHLHISLQSGSDKILKLMKRPYDTSFFSDRLEKLHRKLPDIAISTDIIAGFPGETAADFKATLVFAQQMNFSKIHVFSFSSHERTAAANLPGKVPALEIKQRSQHLRVLSRRLEKKFQTSIKKQAALKPLSLIKEQGIKGGRNRYKTEFGFDLYLSSRQARKHDLV